MTDTANQLKHELAAWIRSLVLSESDKPQNLIFLTLHFCHPKRDIETAKETLRPILAGLLSKLQNKKWYKHPYKSLTIIEHGKLHILHAHTILNIEHKTIEDLEKSLIKTMNNQKAKFTFDIDLSKSPSAKNKCYTPKQNHLLIKPVYDLQKLSQYIIKEYKLNKPYIDTSNLFTSNMLFQTYID
ncbi:MAG: hypothetical protein FWD33_00835 [Alphaproteobacteria bacterium]|nr:hypothetical protein [Alphaproteobacteria bacterium]